MCKANFTNVFNVSNKNREHKDVEINLYRINENRKL